MGLIEAEAASTGLICPYPKVNSADQAAPRRGHITSFLEADVLFQQPPLFFRGERMIWYPTGKAPRGPTTFSNSTNRFTGISRFEKGQLPYIRRTNNLLYQVLNESFSNQIVAAYREDPVNDISRFDRAVYNGVERCLALFAQAYPEYLPVLKCELVDSRIAGMTVAIASARYSLDKFFNSGDIHTRVNDKFPIRPDSKGYSVNRRRFIGPGKVEPINEAVECPGIGIAQAIFEGALEAHERLSPKTLFRRRIKPLPMEPDPDNQGQTERLRSFVLGLYERERERQMAA